MERWATFDCYGTLIDWDGGLLAAFGALFPAHAEDALATFHDVEPDLQADGSRTYRQVLTDAVPVVAARLGVEPTAGASVLADSIPSWPPFFDTAAALSTLRDRGWRLGVLSNTDPDYLDASLAAIGVAVDMRAVASEIGSYKPAFGHWETFFRETGADRHGHVHVAASLFHDVEPCAALGLPCVWVNRRGETSELPRAGEISDLRELPDVLERLVPEDPAA